MNIAILKIHMTPEEARNVAQNSDSRLFGFPWTMFSAQYGRENEPVIITLKIPREKPAMSNSFGSHPADETIKVEQLCALFFNGPTHDGQLISKTARDELVAEEKVFRSGGFNFLSVVGVAHALDLGFGDVKTGGGNAQKAMLRYRENRRKIHTVADLRAALSGVDDKLLVAFYNGGKVETSIGGLGGLCTPEAIKYFRIGERE